jgi:hypothetical protein
MKIIKIESVKNPKNSSQHHTKGSIKKRREKIKTQT